MFDYSFTAHALKKFEKFPKNLQKRIIDKLDYFCSQENPLQYAEFLSDSRLGKFRFRIGDFRVVFDMEDKVLVIHDVGHRKDIYR